MKIGVYTGMFDPFTWGHSHVIEQCAELFDQFHIVIGPNPSKTPLFTMAERVEMINATVNGGMTDTKFKVLELPFPTMDKYVNSLEGDVTVVRGIRGLEDVQYEHRILAYMQERTPKARYIFVMPPERLKGVSSSEAKRCANNGQWGMVEFMVPTTIGEWMYEKYVDKITDHQIREVPYRPVPELEMVRDSVRKFADAGLIQYPSVIYRSQVLKVIDAVPYDVVSSERFVLREVPLDWAKPTGSRFVPCSRSVGPIIIDATADLHPMFQRLGPVCVIEGKHRLLDAIERGRTTIQAWVGDKAEPHLP